MSLASRQQKQTNDALAELLAIHRGQAPGGGARPKQEPETDAAGVYPEATEAARRAAADALDGCPFPDPVPKNVHEWFCKTFSVGLERRTASFDDYPVLRTEWANKIMQNKDVGQWVTKLKSLGMADGDLSEIKNRLDVFECIAANWADQYTALRRPEEPHTDSQPTRWSLGQRLFSGACWITTGGVAMVGKLTVSTVLKLFLVIILALMVVRVHYLLKGTAEYFHSPSPGWSSLPFLQLGAQLLSWWRPSGLSSSPKPDSYFSSGDIFNGMLAVTDGARSDQQPSVGGIDSFVGSVVMQKALTAFCYLR
eukprot:TRINITY_DN14307_c0_g1_i2.p1 TRINITY_DN14307_c0_g1~~TRINITY_DN14307_c0_g1_i2.p1  ORF type:complete len:310 (-),score=40.49 TRINITY_DN14307_c0_g1_i2:513-1442(-)